MAEDEHGGYRVLAAYISDRKKTEFESRKRVEDRGGTIITSSSALVTFIFGIVVFLTGKDLTFTSGAAAVVLLSALAAFVVAACLGIFVQNAPRSHQAVDKETLELFVEQNAKWNGSERNAASDCAWLDIDSIFSLQEGTRLKAKVVVAALLFQALAFVLIAVALGIELCTRGIL